MGELSDDVDRGRWTEALGGGLPFPHNILRRVIPERRFGSTRKAPWCHTTPKSGSLFRNGLLLFSLQWACALGASLPVTGVLPAGTQVLELLGVDEGRPVAIDPTGMRVAYVDKALRIKELSSAVGIKVARDLPTHLAWSTDGTRLAAAFEREGRAQIRLFAAGGEALGETSLPGRITGLQWRRDGILLIGTVEFEAFRFGANYDQMLHQWSGKDAPVAQRLGGGSLMPNVAVRVKDSLPELLGFALSPLEDEVLCYRFHNPPAIGWQLRLHLFHLKTGKSRVLGEVDFRARGAGFDGNGQSLLYGDGTAACRLLDPWRDRVMATFPVPGRRVALAPSSRTVVLDGQIFQDGAKVASLPADCRPLFAGQSGAFFVVHQGRLYHLTGFPVDPFTATPDKEQARLRELRAWLSEGLIDAKDYHQQAEAP